MSRLSKASLHAALDRAAKTIIEAAGDDPFISRREIRRAVLKLTGEERALASHFYRFIDARDAAKGARVTKRDVEAAVTYTKEVILDRYDLNNNGFSKAEIEKMSQLGRLTAAFAIQLKRAALGEESQTSEDIARKLGELTEGMNFTGFGSEGEDALEVVYLPGNFPELDAQILADALGFDTSTPTYKIERFYTYSPELNFELIDTIFYEDDVFGIRTNEVLRYMTTYLHDLIVVIFGEDLNSPPAHPTFWVGLASDGAIVGLRSVVIWT